MSTCLLMPLFFLDHSPFFVPLSQQIFDAVGEYNGFFSVINNLASHRMIHNIFCFLGA